VEFLAGLAEAARTRLPEIIVFGRDVTLYVWGAVPVIVAWVGFLASVRTLTDPTPQSKKDADAAHREQMAAAKAVERRVAQAGEASRGRDEALESKIDELLALERARAEREGRDFGADAAATFEQQVRAILQSKDARKAPAQAALRENRPQEAADALMIVARQEAAAVDDFAREAADSFREAAALYMAEQPGKALAAYREATRLDGGDFWSWIFLARLERDHAGDLGAARAAAARALAVAGDPRERSVAHGEVGDVSVAFGDLAAAKAAYGEGLEIGRALSAADPRSAAARRDVSVSLNKLGDVAVAEGDLAAAKAAYGEGLEIGRALSAADPRSAAARRDVAVSLERLGQVEMAAGNPEAAAEWYRQEAEISAALMAADPLNAGAKRFHAVVLLLWGQASQERARFEEAYAILKALDDAGQLAPRDKPMLDSVAAMLE